MRMLNADALAEAMGVNRIVEQDWKWESAWGVPIVEAEPVKHGKWIEENVRPKSYMWICSECRSVAYMPVKGQRKEAYFRFCPNCGAQMQR